MAASFCRRSFLNYKNCLFQTQKRTGYVVLIPETPEEVLECNVVSLENLPNFSKLSLSVCKQIVNKYAQQYDTGAWELDEHVQKMTQESEKIDVFKHIIEPLEVITLPFLSSWGVAKALYITDQKLMPGSTFHPLSERVMQIRSDKFNIKSVYKACKKYLESESEKCTQEQKRILEKFIWEGFHNGFELSEDKHRELHSLYSLLQVKRTTYDLKMKNSKFLFKQLITDEKFQTEAPLDLLRNTAQDINNPKKGPWIIRLNEFIYWRFLEVCSSPQARRHIWISYNQLCSKALDTRCNAVTDVEDMRRLRHNFAKILGYPTYCHLSMKTKMAGTIENLQDVLTQILEPAKYAQEKEIFDLEKFSYECGSTHALEMCDLPYWMRTDKKMRHGLDEEVLKEYFPLSQVLLGLIALCEQLFGIEIEEQTAIDTWNPDVRYFRITDEKTKTILGGFYFDPYARKGKLVENHDNGWLVAMRPRSKVCASLPLSALVFSFSPPTDNQPSLLYFREVENLFGKFGQMLQFTLTEMNYSEVSGTANIEWDAVDVCNKFLRFWLTEKGTLESISGHYNTGEPLASHLIDNLSNVHKHMAGTQLCKDIYFSNLDLELHLKSDASLRIVERLWPQHLLFQLDPLDYHVYGFSDIFLSPYSSSYYHVVWSKMVAADIFSAFVDVGFKNHEEISVLGRRFRSTYLASGGGCYPGEVFRRFRGRDPSPKALTHLLDLTKAGAPASDVTPELALS